MSPTYPSLLISDLAVAEAVSSGAYPLIITGLFPTAILFDHTSSPSPRVEDEKDMRRSCVKKEARRKGAQDGGLLQRFMRWWKGQDEKDTDNRGDNVVHAFVDGPIASPSALFLASTRSLDAYEWALDIGGRRRSLHSYLST